MYETSSRSRIRCEEHPNQQIANYCCNFNCLRPLCPECVEVHTKTHSKQEIESWKNCLNKNHKNIKATTTRLKEILSRMNQVPGGRTIEAIEDQAMKRMALIRKDLHDTINQIMNQHEKQIRYIIQNQFRSSPTDLSKLKMAIEELEKLVLKLANTSTVLPALKKSILLDHESLVSHFQNQYRNRPQRDGFRDEFPISIDQEGYVRFKKLVDSLVIYSKEPIRTRQLMPPKSALVPHHDPHHAAHDHQPRPYREGPRNRAAPIQIDTPNYFRQTNSKYLHFFVPFSNELKLLHVNNILGGNMVPKWKTVRLNIKAQIPSFYKSIITPDGQIYLTGGSSDVRTKLNTVYRFNQEKSTLDFIGTMIVPRSSHAICYSQNNLYIIGGFKPNNQVLTDCEVFNLSTRKSRSIASLCFPSANSCANSFNQTRIFKFGGVHNRLEPSNHIEMYSIRDNTWTAIDPTLQKFDDRLWLLSFSACVQISPYQMFIFGGYNDSEDEASSNLSYTLAVEDGVDNTTYTLRNIDTFPLPQAEGFWDNNPIVSEGVVIALQNITDTDGVSSLIDERRILLFDGTGWKTS